MPRVRRKQATPRQRHLFTNHKAQSKFCNKVEVCNFRLTRYPVLAYKIKGINVILSIGCNAYFGCYVYENVLSKIIWFPSFNGRGNGRGYQSPTNI